MRVVYLLFLALVVSVRAQSVSLAEIGTLTFQPGANVSSRLEFPRPQITCRGGQCHKTPDVIECAPVVEGFEVAWDCDGGPGWDDILGRSFISCENYDADTVLSGSCSIDLDVRDKDHQLPHPADDVAYKVVAVVVIIIVFMIMLIPVRAIVCLAIAPFLLLYWGVMYHFEGSWGSFCTQLAPRPPRPARTLGKSESAPTTEDPVPPNDVGFDPPPPRDPPPPPPFDAPYVEPPPTYDSVVE